MGTNDIRHFLRRLLSVFGGQGEVSGKNKTVRPKFCKKYIRERLFKLNV